MAEGMERPTAAREAIDCWERLGRQAASMEQVRYWEVSVDCWRFPWMLLQGAAPVEQSRGELEHPGSAASGLVRRTHLR
jgi:hypothetical protein